MTTTPDVEAAREALREFIAESRREFDTDPGWIADRADARALGLKPGAVYSFKQRHNLPRDQRLSPDARELLALELETAQRAIKGQAIARSEALAAITERATGEAAAALAVALPTKAELHRAGSGWVMDSEAEAYLLNRLEFLTGKRYASTGTARKRCEALAPAAAPAAARLDRFHLALFWGAVLRLDQLEGPAPLDPAAFYRWSQLEAYSRHNRPIPSLGDVLAGRMGEEQARQLLALPVSGPLEPAAIRSAYRSQARDAHPDAGGDRHRFERLAEARDRLLLGVA